MTLLVFSSVSLGTELSGQQTHMASAVTESKFLAGFTLIGLSTSQDSCEGFRVQSSGETAGLPKSPTLLACSVWQGLLPEWPEPPSLAVETGRVCKSAKPWFQTSLVIDLISTFKNIPEASSEQCIRDLVSFFSLLLSYPCLIKTHFFPYEFSFK